jgi:electron transfer flavoprotein beta subunit
MNIFCCIKQVPDTTQIKIDPETNTLIRAGVESICNPYDLVAVECAVQIKEKIDAQITVLSMGILQAESALRECLAIGVDQAVLLSDKAFMGSDTLATSAALSETISMLSRKGSPMCVPPTPMCVSPELIICGRQAIDGDTAQTGPGIATRLNSSLVTNVIEIIEVSTESITVKKQVKGGHEIVKSKFPTLITVELNCCEPRYSSLPLLIESIRKPVRIITADKLNTDQSIFGLKGSPTSVKSIFAPPKRDGGPAFNKTDEFIDHIKKSEPQLMELISNA